MTDDPCPRFDGAASSAADAGNCGAAGVDGAGAGDNGHCG